MASTLTSRWIINTPYSSGTLAFTAAELNSLASGGGALSTTVVTNSTALDMMCQASFVVTVGGTTTAQSILTLFLLPLNQDGSTYGDGYASSTTTQPVQTYQISQCLVKSGVASGSTVAGTFGALSPMMLPPGDFKFALGQNLAVALSATAALTMKYRTFNANLANLQ